MVEQEMLSYAACLHGQSLVLNTQGKNAIRRHAMQQFLTSAGSVTLLCVSYTQQLMYYRKS